MTPRIHIVCLALSVLLIPLKATGRADEPKKAGELSSADLVHEISVLRTLYYLKTTPEQARALLDVAKETAGKPKKEKPPKISMEHHQLLADLHDALADDDEEAVEELEDKLEELIITEAPELDEDVPITDAARKRAPEVLRTLKANQVATFLGAHAELTSDPLEKLLDALERVRGLGLVEWKETREELGDAIGMLVAGEDKAKAEKVRDDTIDLLARARTLKADEFAAQKEKLEGVARRIVGNVGPMEVLSHLMEHALAQMLSNPRVDAALRARAK